MSKHFHGKHGPLLVAEIGGNHEGNFDYAKRLAQLAIDTDVDYVKFQIYTGDRLVSSVENPDRNKHFKRFELSKDEHRYLAEMVTKSGLKYTSSVWDIEAMKWIDEFISIYKIGSGDLTAYPILSKTAQKGKPMIISTGLATIDEVVATVRFIQESNPVYESSNMLAVLQCTTMYPINAEDANLNVMRQLKQMTGMTIGYSDHTEGTKALQYAAAMGAEILEFHFTDSREGKVFRDHKVSVTPDEVENLIDEIKLIRVLQGSPEKRPVQIEIENGHLTTFRRAVYPSCNIKAGEILTEDNLTVLRPNIGIDARDYNLLLGKKALVDIPKHKKIEWKFLT